MLAKDVEALQMREEVEGEMPDLLTLPSNFRSTVESSLLGRQIFGVDILPQGKFATSERLPNRHPLGSCVLSIVASFFTDHLQPE